MTILYKWKISLSESRGGGGEGRGQNSKGLGKLAIVREALKSGNEFETAENFKRNFNHLHQRKFIVHLFHHRFIK